jgi:hypothetical protein
MQYWKTHRKEIILTYLTSVFGEKLEFTMWQQHGSHRYTFKGSFKEVSRKNCRIKLLLSDNLQLFNDDLPLYVHITQLDIVFKKEHFKRSDTLIDFSLPGEIQLFERRKARRFYYQYQDHKSITYRSEAVDPETEKPAFTHSSVLVDISTTGAGLVVGKNAIQDLEVDKILLLDNLTDQQLPSPFKIKVKYIQPYISNEQGLYKIGIKFDDELNLISYKSITSIIEIKQKKIQGLTDTQYCGVDSEEQINLLNKIESTNKILANNIKDNIEYLDKLRYMTTHMKVDFLKNINHDLLAIALRLSSKELIFDLFSELTQTMQEEFLEKLEVERPASAVCKAQEDIIKEIRQKENNGEIVLDPKAFITYV